MDPAGELAEKAISMINTAATHEMDAEEREKAIIVAKKDVDALPFPEREQCMIDYWQELVMQEHLKVVTVDGLE